MMPGPPFVGILSPADADHIDSEIGKLWLKVAARLSPPNSIKTRSSPGKRRRISATAARLSEASSRMAVCGQPPVSTPVMRSGASAPERVRNSRILFGVDVIGDRGDVVVIAHALHSRSISAVLPEPTGPPTPTRSGPWGRRDAVHVRNSLVYWVSCRMARESASEAALRCHRSSVAGNAVAGARGDDGFELGDRALPVGLTERNQPQRRPKRVRRHSVEIGGRASARALSHGRPRRPRPPPDKHGARPDVGEASREGGRPGCLRYVEKSARPARWFQEQRSRDGGSATASSATSQARTVVPQRQAR